MKNTLDREFTRLKIPKKHRCSLKRYLDLIERKDKKTYQHSIRVALLGIKVAEFLKIDSKPLFYAGLLHDFGKIRVEAELLRKEGRFTAEDMKKMEVHPVIGYFLLKGVYDFSAEIILRHHRFCSQPYPTKLPKSDISFSRKSKKLINKYARLLALIDFYDAVSTRKDSKYTKKLCRHTPSEVRRILIKFNQGQKDLIKELYQAKIFGQPIEKVMKNN